MKRTPPSVLRTFFCRLLGLWAALLLPAAVPGEALAATSTLTLDQSYYGTNGGIADWSKATPTPSGSDVINVVVNGHNAAGSGFSITGMPTGDTLGTLSLAPTNNNSAILFIGDRGAAANIDFKGAATLSGGTLDNSPLLFIRHGSSLTTTGTTLTGPAELSLGNVDWSYRTDAAATHTGDITVNGSAAPLQVNIDTLGPSAALLRGARLFNGIVHVYGAAQGTPNKIDGDLKLGSASTGGSLIFGSGEQLDKAGSWLNVTGNADFAANSSLVTFSATQNMLDVTGTLTVADGSQLYVAGGQAGEYTLVKAGTLNQVDPQKAWVNANLASNALFTASGAWDTGNKTYTLTLQLNDVGVVLPDLDKSMAGVMNEYFARYGVNAGSDSAAQRFLSRASDPAASGSPRASAAAVEGAARAAAVAGVPTVSMNAATMAGNAAATRTGSASPAGTARSVALNSNADGVSLDSGMSAGSGYKSGLAIWAMPLYQHESVSGLQAGNFKTGYNADLYGMALGGDITVDDTWRIGLSINAGGGQSRSTGDLATTKTDIAFWGVTLYGGWQWDKLTLSGDVGYTATDNEVRQDTPAFLNMGTTKADVEGRVWSSGIRAEYSIPTEALDFTPYAGVRYNHVITPSYSVENEGTLFNMDETTQKVWLFPAGVTLSKDIEVGSGWSLTPRLSLGAVFAAGDVDSESRARVPGVDAVAVMKTQAVDHATFDSTLGLEARNDEWALGVNYNFQASDKRNAHGVTATFRYAF